MLTGTEQGALRREAIKIEVDSRRGEEARAKANFVVDGYPEDFFFRLGPETEKLRNGEATIRFGLSPRKREVLDFAIKSCRGASLDLTATAAKRTGHLGAQLRLPKDCAAAGG